MYVSKVYQIAVDSYGDVRTLVRGLPYQCPDDWEGVLDSIDEDSNLYLIKEPDNPKDPLAIAAYLDDRRVGYVAASDNAKIWLYLTDEKMPCTFVERFEASFKISFENPRSLFEGMPFEDIYRDKDGMTEEPNPAFDIPFLTNPKDKDYDWYDDRTYIMDLEKFIPDFRRKLAARLIVLVGRKNSKGEYCYYLPYANNILTDIKDDTIRGLVDEHGFVIALPDVPMKTEQGGIIMDLHVTYLTRLKFWTFDSMHQSEFVFHLRPDSGDRPKTKKKKTAKKSQDVGIYKNPLAKRIQNEESYDITDSSDGGKHVSMDVIIPEDGDENFDFYSYECHISDKKQTAIITKYMKRYEQGKESRPFLMIGRPCLGLDNIDIFYSLDGEIIFNFIFDDKIKGWIREAGFVLGKVKEYHFFDLTDSLNLTLSVSKRKSGEALFKQASEEAMDYIEEYCSSQADHDVEARIIDAVEKYMSGDSPMSYKVVIVPQYGIGACTTLDGEDIAIIVDDEIIELAEKNKGVFGYITKVDYDDDGNAWFTIRVSRSVPRLTLEQDSEALDSAEAKQNSSAIEEQGNVSTIPSISEEVFAKFIKDNIGCDVLKAPNSSWKYDKTDFLGDGYEMYETYIFKKRVLNNPKCKEIETVSPEGKIVNFTMDFKMNKKEILDFVYKYKKIFFPNYTLAKCKKEYSNESSIHLNGLEPILSISPPLYGETSYRVIFYTSFCNKNYIEKQKAKKKLLTLEK
jgi:hypothetical protein